MRDVFDGDLKDFENVDSTAGVYAKFYWHPKLDEAASAAGGRPIHVDREYVEIISAGNSTNIVRRPVTDMDRRRFRQAYAAFKQGDLEQVIGTPLAEVSWISRSMVEELAYKKVRTLEQLADLNDQACTATPGLFDLKRKAAAWMKKSSDAAPFTVLQKENEELKSRLAALEAMMIQPPKKEKRINDH